MFKLPGDWSLLKMSNERPTMEEEARPKMRAILEGYGLQITLKTLADSLEELIRKRGPSVEACMAVETIKGLHAGYMRRHEEDDEISDNYDFDMER
jgi:hypothetical protein